MPEAPAPDRRTKILVVEDDAGVRRVVVRMLEAADLETAAASPGSER